MLLINKKASFDYEKIEEISCGIKLLPSEVKSIAAGDVNISNSFVRVDNGSLIVYDMHIGRYKNSLDEIPEKRERILLANKKEIERIYLETRKSGNSIIPYSLYKAPNGKYKLTIWVCKGKKMFDKRESIKQKESQKEIKKFI